MEDNTVVPVDRFVQTKMLILFVMSHLSHPVTMEQLSELVMCDERVSYFDVTDCIQKLLPSKYLILKNDRYSLTPKGIRSSETLEKELPHSVRVKVSDAAARLNDILESESIIKTSVKTDEAGRWNAGICVSDGVGEIMSINLLASNKKHAVALKKGLQKKAQTLYHDIIKLILNPNP